MTELTDHRVEAERWLAKVEKGQQADTAAAHALIAIAHDLHRIADAMTFIPTAIPAEEVPQ